MTKYRIIKRNTLWKRYVIQTSDNKKKYEDFMKLFTENGARKKLYELFGETYNKTIRKIDED